MKYSYEEILKHHDYKITPPSGKSKRWSTYVKTESGRKKISKTNKQDLIFELANIYQHKLQSHMTLKEFFPEWLNHKKISTRNSETLRRHQQHFHLYYSQSEFANRPMYTITKLDIEVFIHETIKKYNLSCKELNNMLIICKNAFQYAYDKGILPSNEYIGVTINKRLCRHIQKKNNNTQVFFDDEINLLYKQINLELTENPTTAGACLSILFQFETAARISEIAALKFEDIEIHNNATYINIRRMECKTSIYNTTDNSFSKPIYRVEEHTKTNNDKGDRLIPLTDKALDIIEYAREINTLCNIKCDNYIFNTIQGRVTTRQITYRLRKLCHYAGIPNKTSHCIRRTTASKLHARGVPLPVLMNLLGHQNEETTFSYLHNQYSDEKTIELIKNALSH